MNSTTSTPPALAIPTASLAPNQYSGSYLIALQLTAPRSEITKHSTTADGTKLWQYRGQLYAVPRQKDAPPRGRRWELIGKRHSREIYVAVSR